MIREKTTAVFRLKTGNSFISKQELACEYSVSRNTFGRYLRKMEHRLPDYRRSQQLLSPAQVRVVRELMG